MTASVQTAEAVMRIAKLLLLTLIIVAIAGPAFAQATNPNDVSWAALDPGNDWAAQVLRSLFPIPGGTPGTATGNEATVIGQIVGQFTGFIAAIACAFVCYSTVMSIHRAAESSQILGNGQTWMFVVRTGFAGIMMFPLGGGFSAGQQMVMQGAMWGVGMAKALYANAIQAVGPDAAVIAQPMIPGTETIIAGLVDNELCMDLVNLASNTAGANAPLVPTPQALTVNDNAGSGYVTWRYGLSTDNESGDPACGTVTVRESGQNASTIAGVTVDMAAVQQAVLTNVLNGDIRTQVASVAQNLWQNKTSLGSHPAPRGLQHGRQRLHQRTHDRRDERTKRDQRRHPGQCHPGAQRQSQSARRRGAAIDPRLDRRRRLLSRNRQVECVHSLPDERDPGHHVTDLPGPGSRPLL
jgi:hypothetical protein